MRHGTRLGAQARGAGASADEEFRAYVAARSPALLRTAYLLTGDRHDAEDLLQTALAKTYLAWGRIRERGALDGYVRRTMVNTNTSWWRRRRHLTEHPVAEPPERVDSADHAGATVLAEVLWQALAKLPKRQRAALVLRFYEDLSEAETAVALGVSVGTVKSTTSRGLARLRGVCVEMGLAEDDPRLLVGAGSTAQGGRS
jgi:RNA polymerase sigma-70 factor (sigma-E family)